MKRILVIEDIRLWLALNRHFAGCPGVRLNESPTMELGLRLAQVDSPDLIVCRADDGEHSPLALARLFRDREIHARRVICVHNQASGEVPEEIAEIGSQDAESLGILEGDEVDVVTSSGRFRARATVMQGAPPGLVRSTGLFGQLAADLQASKEPDPMARVPRLDVVAARLEKAIEGQKG